MITMNRIFSGEAAKKDHYIQGRQSAWKLTSATLRLLFSKILDTFI